MGIRFLCPNGHKLNVKAFLAGKRGICPNCDAKFVVPATSGGQAEAIDAASADAADIEAVDLAANLSMGPGDALQRGYSGPPTEQSSEPSSPVLPAPPPSPVPPPPVATATAATPPAEVWYIRTASGEQFGPASREVMLGWVAAGRVATDCWVWQSDWPDWKPGGEALTLLDAPPSPISTSSPAPAPESLVPNIPAQPAPDTLPDASTATASYLAAKRNREDRARKATLFLGVAVVVLLAVLVVVLMKNN